MEYLPTNNIRYANDTVLLETNLNDLQLLVNIIFMIIYLKKSFNFHNRLEVNNSVKSTIHSIPFIF